LVVQLLTLDKGLVQGGMEIGNWHRRLAHYSPVLYSGIRALDISYEEDKTSYAGLPSSLKELSQLVVLGLLKRKDSDIGDMGIVFRVWNDVNLGPSHSAWCSPTKHPDRAVKQPSCEMLRNGLSACQSLGENSLSCEFPRWAILKCRGRGLGSGMSEFSTRVS
jgi:hypothetical protein